MRSAALPFAVLIFAGSATAQLPAVRTLPAPDATSADLYSIAVEVRPLSDGRILVNDPTDRRLVMADDKLAMARVLFDSTTPAPLTYPHSTPRLVAVAGDTTWLGEPDARGFRVLAPDGHAVRRQALADLRDMSALTFHFAGTALDAAGNIVFAESVRPTGPRLGPPSGALQLIRLHSDGRRDTIASIMSVGVMNSVSVPVMTSTVASPVPTLPAMTVPAFQTGDAWTVLPSGVVAVVRAADYHVDWNEASGAWHSTPRVAWQWKLLTPDDKKRLVDSAQRYYAATDSQRRPPTVTLPDGRVQRFSLGPTIVSPDVPDTVPAIAPLTAHADRRGRIWVREGPGGPTAGPAIFDVIDGRGQLVDRVQLEKGESLIAFGPNDTVFLAKQEPGRRVRLLRTHFPRR